jgi:hypothetical protein
MIFFLNLYTSDTDKIPHIRPDPAKIIKDMRKKIRILIVMDEWRVITIDFQCGSKNIQDEYDLLSLMY